MNAKTDRWETYTDKAGRRHWRWPASQRTVGTRRPRRRRGFPAARRIARAAAGVFFAPLLARGK